MAKVYSNWKFRADITVTNPNSQDGFQASFELAWLPGMRADFRDIRFADKNENPLSYWIESKTDFSSAVVWVRLPANDKKIILYYGNGAAVSESFPDNVFDLYDDFSGTVVDENIWTIEKKGSTDAIVEVTGGTLHLAGKPNTISSGNIISKTGFDRPFIVEYRDKHSEQFYSDTVVGSGSIGDTEGGTSKWWHTTLKSGYDIFNQNTGDSVNRSSSTGTLTELTPTSSRVYPTNNTYYVHQIILSSTQIIITRDGTTIGTGTDSTYTTGLKIHFSQGEYSIGYGGDRYIDWICVRKYAATEPTLALSRKYPNPDFFFPGYIPYIAPTEITVDAFTAVSATAILPVAPITVDAFTAVSGNALCTAGEISASASSQVSAVSTRHDHFPVAAATKITPHNIPLRGFVNLKNYAVTDVSISRTISDCMWQMTANIVGHHLPREYMHVDFSAVDLAGSTRNLFTGVIPDSRFICKLADNKSSVTAYDYGFYLSKQKVPYLETVMNLQGAYTSWDQWVVHLLENTGVLPYKINKCSAADKEFQFNATTTKQEAINQISEYTGFVFYVGWINAGTEENPDLKPVAWFVDANDMDYPVKGLDLPAPLTITWPDSSLVEIPAIQSVVDESYNRIIVRGVDGSGTWYTATAQTASVTAGDEYPREYYEESSDWNTQAKCNTRAAALLAYFSTDVYKVHATFLKRFDLQLWQKIRFSGAEFPGKLTGMGWLRVISVQYSCSDGDESVTIEAIKDRDMNLQVSRIDSIFGDSISETKLMIDSAIGELTQPEIGTVTAISVDGKTATILTERGTPITARILFTDGVPVIGELIMAYPLPQGGYVVPPFYFGSTEPYLPPPEYSYHDFSMYTNETGRWIYGDSGAPDVFLKTDGTGWANSQALFAFLFEDNRESQADCYIDVRMVNNTHFEIWAGPSHNFGYYNYLYYKNTLLTKGSGDSMPSIHVILPI